jgi:hypothetical protein
MPGQLRSAEWIAASALWMERRRKLLRWEVVGQGVHEKPRSTSPVASPVSRQCGAPDVCACGVPKNVGRPWMVEEALTIGGKYRTSNYTIR